MDSPSSAYAPIVLRFGLVVLFLWFGLSQITSPASWISWVPESATSISGLSPTLIVLFNGSFETILGIFLAVGFRTRWVALLLSLHLFFIAYEIGYNDVGVRDFVLAISTLAIAMYGSDKYTFDRRTIKTL